MSLLYKFLPETNQHLDHFATRWRVIMINYGRLLRHRNFIAYTLCSSLALSGYVAYYAICPFLLQNQMGLTPVEYGWVTIGLALGLCIGQFTNARIVLKYGYYQVLRVGLFLMVFSGLAMLIASLAGWTDATSIIIPSFMFTIASGLVFANAMTGAFQSFAKIAGFAGAMYGFTQITGAAWTSTLVSSAHQESQLFLAVVFLVLGITAWGLFVFIIRDENESALQASRVELITKQQHPPVERL